MKKLKKLFAMVLMFSMLFTSASFSVFAEEKVATPVTVNDIRVIYTDGRAVEDGHMFDVFDSAGSTTTYTVKNGKLSGVKIMPNEQHKIFISWDDVDFSWDYEIVMGGEASFKVGVSEGSTQLMRWNADTNTVSEKPVDQLVIKKFGTEDPTEPVVPQEKPEEKPEQKPEEQGKDVAVADIPVVYEDGTPVEDGVVIDAFDMATFLSGPVHYTVLDGKISGVKMRALSQYKIGFDVKNDSYAKFEVVGAYNSKKLYRVYAKYQNQLPLHYDYDEGINAPEKVFEKIVVKKVPAGQDPTQPRPTSCIMNLQISDGGFQAEGGLPFQLVRVDNGKRKTVYSQQGELTLIADANIEYRLELAENPIYKLDKPIEFSCLLDKEGKYQAVRKGGDVNDPKDYITCSYVELTRIDGKKPQGNKPEEKPNTDKFDPVYVEGTVILKNMKVMELDKDGKETSLDKKIKFVFYNATTQTIEKTVYSENGKLSDVEMMKGQNYIVFAEDSEYTMPNSYLFLKKTGEQPSCYKCGKKEDGFYLTKRSTVVDEKDINRVYVDIPVFAEDGKQIKRPVKFRFVSPLETVEAMSDTTGNVKVGLLEDNNYMVLVEDEEYSIESFPLAIKDKSEYGYGKHPFNHFTCGSMSGLILVKKGTEHAHDTVLVSADKKTSLTGLNFRGGDFHLNVRVLNEKIEALQGKDYEVLDIDTINMYRTEISKLAAGNFTITRELPKGKIVREAYYIDSDGSLKPVKFTNKDGKVCFNMDSVSLYNNVLVYESAENQNAGSEQNNEQQNIHKPGTDGNQKPNQNVGNEQNNNQQNIHKPGTNGDQKPNQNNSDKKPVGTQVPKTDDETNVLPIAGTMFMSIVCIGVVLLIKKRYKRA